MTQGSNASQGGKGSGIVGFQRVTIGKNRIPTAGMADGVEPAAIYALDTTPYSYAAYVKLLNKKEMPMPEWPEDADAGEWEIADRMLTYDVNPADLDPRVSPETIVEAMEMLDEARENYIHSPYPPSSSSNDPDLTQGLAMDAYEMLGFENDAAYLKTMDVFTGLQWEGPRSIDSYEHWI